MNRLSLWVEKYGFRLAVGASGAFHYANTEDAQKPPPRQIPAHLVGIACAPQVYLGYLLLHSVQFQRNLYGFSLNCPPPQPPYKDFPSGTKLTITTKMGDQETHIVARVPK